MIRVTVELVPFGDEDKKKVIGEMLIANDGTGTQKTGNYVGVYSSDRVQSISKFLGNFPREYGVWKLVQNILSSEEEVGSFREPLLRRLKGKLK